MRFVATWLITLCFSLITTPKVHAVAAEECSYYNLSDPGMPMEKIPVLDQGDLPLCTSFTSAVFLRTLFENQIPVNPILLAADYNATQLPDDRTWLSQMMDRDSIFGKYDHFTEGGNFCNLLKHSARNGICFHPSLDDPTVHYYIRQKAEILTEIKKLYPNSMPNLHYYKKFLFETCTNCYTPRYPDTQDITAIAQLTTTTLDILDHTMRESDSTGEILRKTIFSFCDYPSSRLPLPKIECEELKTKKNPEKFTREVNRYFDEKPKHPLPIAFESDPVFKPKEIPRKSSSHSTLLIGRRKNTKTGACEFLIRNSYGADCDFYEGNFDCKDGSVWVNAQTLGQHSLYINQITVGK